MEGGDKVNHSQCRPKNPCLLIRQLVELIEHPISQNATERHLQILNEFLNASHYAFWLQDIPYIIRLFEYIVKMVDMNPEYKKPLECLLYYSAVPPMLTKNSDILEYGRDYQEYFSVLGYLILCLSDDDLKKHTLKTIKKLLNPKPPIGFCCIQLEYTHEAIERSQLPEILGKLVPIVSDDLYPLLLDTMFFISEISTRVCKKMLTENPIEFLIQRFEPNWRERDVSTKPVNPSAKDDIPTFNDTCCVLWKLLLAVDEKDKMTPPTTFALWSLQYALRWSTIRLAQKVNRNNLVALIVKILMLFPNIDFVQSGLCEDVAIIAMSATGCLCRSSIQFTEDGIDFELKKIIWGCLYYFPQHEGSEKISKEIDLMKAFVKYVFQEHVLTKNHIQQYCKLAKIVLKLLPKFLTHSWEKFISLNGPLKIVKIIEGYLVKQYETDVLEAYMYILSEALLLEIQDILLVVGENNAADVVIEVCHKILSCEILISTHQKILARGFCILQKLLDTGFATIEQAVNLCTKFLKRVIHPNLSDPIFDTRAPLCAMRLLWDCIFKGQSRKELHYRQFLKKGGIYIVLDIIETCAFPVKVLSLGVLADMATMPSSVPYLITWRKNGRRILTLLMNIFRNKTEKRCDGITGFEPKQANLWLSLCQGQRVTFYPSCISHEKLLQSCRYNIHGILYALKVRYKEKVEVANSHYQLYNETLNIDDELTMLFAENFLSLKMCESWMTVFKELKNDRITPDTKDQEQLTEKIETIQQWKSYLQLKIQHIWQKEQQQGYSNEIGAYTTLKEARLADALDGLKELRFISNCTERMFQMRKKLRLQEEVERVHAKGSNFHRTITELPFTNIYNQSYSIQSNVIIERKEDQIPPSPVSSESDMDIESQSDEEFVNEHQFQC